MTISAPTIYALSTPNGFGALAVIRLSGAKSAQAIEILTKKTAPPARLASVRTLYDPVSGAELDEALVLVFHAPASFTGEDMAELQLHGGVAVCELVLAALAKINGLEPAAAGAFSRQAVLNGRMDLTRAEGIADLINAETTAQHRQAFAQMRGALGVLYTGWRTRLSHALAHLEADIEFADEDLPGGIGVAVLADMHVLAAEIATHLSEPRGRSLRDGIEIAIIGAPNVGKSSLLNSLVGREAAIVSARAGTTRDIVEVTLTLGDVPVVMADTAGIRVAGDEIEREGVRRARRRAEEADIRLFVSAADSVGAEKLEIAVQDGDYHIVNKIDLAGADKEITPLAERSGISEWHISVKTGLGVTDLLGALEKDVQARFGLSDHPALTRERHKHALEAAFSALNRGLSLQRGDSDAALELVAEDLRQAMRDIGRITGAVDIEALLDIVFRDFCIGK